jgi:hypothetical protein
MEARGKHPVPIAFVRTLVFRSPARDGPMCCSQGSLESARSTAASIRFTSASPIGVLRQPSPLSFTMIEDGRNHSPSGGLILDKAVHLG